MRFESRTKIVGTDGTDVFEKAKPVLEEALEAMMRRPESLGPFLVLEDVASGRFVQWCGSQTRALRFECPEIDLSEERGHRPDEASVRGLSVLRQRCEDENFGPAFSAGVVVIERDTWDADVRPADRRRLSIAVNEAGVWKEHSRQPSVEHAKEAVASLEGEWQVVDLDQTTLMGQIEWWERNPWTRSETAKTSTPEGEVDGDH